jgi:hypothetical protein
VLLIGTRGTDDLGIRKPLVTLNGPDDVLYVKAYDEKHATIKRFVNDPGSEKFGLPAQYDLKPSDFPGFVGSKAGLLVDATRCLHVAEGADDHVFGRPRLERALNRIFDLDKIAASVGESYWQAVVRILQAEIDPNATVTEAQMTDLSDKMAEMVHDLRRQFFGQGTKLSWLGTDVNPPKEIGDFYFALIAIASRIPRRILFGNEAGDLASSTDEATYFGMINERQEHYAEPQMVRAFIDTLIKTGGLPQPKGKGGKYEVQWEPMFELTELELADANLKRAQTAQALTPMGGDPLQLIEIDEDRNVWLVVKAPGNPDDVLPPVPTTPPVPLGADGQPIAEPAPNQPGGTPPATPPAPAPQQGAK